jgi:hypothetical protein
MDKNKFWLGGRLFNTASPRLGVRNENARHGKLGTPTATQTSANGRNLQQKRKLGAPTARHVRKMVAQTQNSSATKTSTQGSTRLKGAGGWIRTNFGLEVDFLIWPHQGWAPQRNARHVRNGRPNNTRHVRKLGAPTQRKARPQVGRPKHVRNANARHVRNARHAASARPQVGRPNAMQGTSARWSPKRKTHPQRKRPHKGALG